MDLKALFCDSPSLRDHFELRELITRARSRLCASAKPICRSPSGDKAPQQLAEIPFRIGNKLERGCLTFAARQLEKH
jgi:hypothetical protein